MSPFGKRLLKRSAGVAIVLGIMGYVFAEAFLMLQRMNGGVAVPANDAVRWRTPLTMAGIGVILHVMIELIAYAVRPRKPLAASEPANSAGQSVSPTP